MHNAVHRLTAMSQLTEFGDSRLDWDLVDRLHKSLRVSGVSVAEMAESLEVHRNTVTNYLSGRVTPDRRTKIVWAMTVGLPFEWIDQGQMPTGPGPNNGGSGVTDT